MKNYLHTLVLTALAAFLFALAVSPSAGCVGAPTSVEELDAWVDDALGLG